MKSIKNNRPTPGAIPFPKLMQGSGGDVYLMTCPTGGCRVHANQPMFRLGERRDDWIPKHMVNFHGSITLMNGEPDD